jgi:purine-binding chemotaxis protein CheW
MSRQLVSFQIGDQHLGVDIMSIREIRAWSPATRLPHTPHHVSGVVNLRGTVLPIIDLSLRLGWGPTDVGARHVIIVVRIGTQLNGLIVDAVNDIVTLADDALQPSPDAVESDLERFVEGIATIDGRMLIVLALEHLAIEDSNPIPQAA